MKGSSLRQISLYFADERAAACGAIILVARSFDSHLDLSVSSGSDSISAIKFFTSAFSLLAGVPKFTNIIPLIIKQTPLVVYNGYWVKSLHNLFRLE